MPARRESERVAGLRSIPPEQSVCELLFPHHKSTGVTAVAQLQLTVHFKLGIPKGTVGSKGWSGQRSEHQGQRHLSSLSTQHGSDELA
ncbi:hypothetical protein MHYP_G00235460 [Metynnis hypsauchen]